MNIGDKIRVVDCAENKHNGKLGKIVDFDTLGEPSLKVTFSDEVFDDEWFCAYELELMESTKKEPKPIKTNRLEELTTALNTLGSLGIELDVKIHAEINGKKIEL